MVYLPIDDSRFAPTGAILDGAVSVSASSNVSIDGETIVPFGTTATLEYSYALGAPARDFAFLSSNEVGVVRGTTTNQIRRIDSAGSLTWAYDWGSNIGLTQGRSIAYADGNFFGANSDNRVGEFDASTGAFTAFLNNPWGGRQIQMVRPSWDGLDVYTIWRRSNSTTTVNRGVVAKYSSAGSLLWSWQPVGTAAGSGYAEDTICLTAVQDRVYVMFSSGDVRCFQDSDGTLLWTANLTNSLAVTTVSPNRMAVNRQRLVTIAGTGTTQVAIWHDLDGNELFRLDYIALGIVSTDSITAIAIDNACEVYLGWTSSSTGRRQYQRWTFDGNFIYATTSTAWGNAYHIDVNSNGWVFVGGSLNSFNVYSQA
jgi:hypothetical protein